MAFLGDLLIRMRADTADFQSDMGKASYVAEKTMKRITSAAGKLGLVLGSLGTVRFAQSLIDDADAMSKLAQKTNMAVDQVAGWSHALDLAGVSQEALQKTAKSLGTQMLDASMGLAEAKRNFAALEIDIKKNDGSLKSVNAVLLEVADRYANATDKTAAAALMNKVLGKSALDLIPAFKDGRAALESMIAEGQRLNPITEESARQAEQFNDNMTRLSKTIKSSFISAMNSALPALSEMSDNLASAASKGNMFWGVMNEGAKLYLATVGTLFPFLEDITQKGFNALSAKPGQTLWEQMQNAKKGAAPAAKPFTPKIFDETAGKKASDAAKKLREMHEKGEVAAQAERVKRMQDELIASNDFKNLQFEADEKLRELGKKGEEDAFIERARRRQEEMEAINDFRNAEFDAINKVNDASKELGMTFSSAFEDAIINGKKFQDVLKGILQDVLRIAARKAITEPLANNISSIFSGMNFGSMFGGGGGGGGDFAFAMGSYAAGTDYVPRTGMYQLHQGEQVIPASQNGKGGNITFAPVIQIDSRTDAATIARTVDGAMRQSEARLIEQLNRGQGGISQAVRRV